MENKEVDVMLGFHVPNNSGKTTKHHGSLIKASIDAKTPGRFSIFSRFETILGANINRISFRFDDGEVLMLFNCDKDKGIPFYPSPTKYIALNNADLARNILDTLDVKFEYEKGFFFDIEKAAKLGSMQFWKMVPVKRVPETIKRGPNSVTRNKTVDRSISEDHPVNILDKAIKEGDMVGNTANN